ncbi:ABC transporter ATP-binding protein [Gemmatimonadales bacterium]|nr:ABC transporter ATP-binding protein [Gemmatimonadales bacterium]
MKDRGPSIELIDVSKSYREGSRTHGVLADASTTILPGERVAILGPSGSGKSTLLNLVSGIDRPDQGRVIVGGVDIGTLSERDRTLFRREKVGFVFQFFNLLPTLTALENLLLPLELTNENRKSAEVKARRLLEAVKLGDRADAFPDRLSGGEQQRIAIARALIHGPGLLLADEPTGNLDQDTGQLVVGLLEDLVSVAGATLIVVTHAPKLAERMDRVLRVDRGRLVEV